MARTEKSRKVCNPPRMVGFRPFGQEIREQEPVVIHFDEYESLKLVGYDLLSQEDAAVRMNISRPTLTRIYNNALHKMIRAFVEGRAIFIRGGNIEFDREWYKCRKCFRLIDGTDNHVKCEGCRSYGPDELIRLDRLMIKKGKIKQV